MIISTNGTTIEQRGTEILIRLPAAIATTSDCFDGSVMIRHIGRFTEAELETLLGIADRIYQTKLYLNEENVNG